jgi:ferredoxin
MCVELAPEVFQLSYGCVDIPKPNIDATDTQLVARVRQAVYRCPAKALLISSE